MNSYDFPSFFVALPGRVSHSVNLPDQKNHLPGNHIFVEPRGWPFWGPVWSAVVSTKKAVAIGNFMLVSW